MTGLGPEDDTVSDFTSQISGKLGSPVATGFFGHVYRCTIEPREGKIEVAVKVFKIDPWRDTEKIQKRIRRALKAWLRLKRPNIVPLLGIAYVEGPFPALVSQWMSFGTLYTHLQTRPTITTVARVVLAKGVADGLNYLHSENVVHGDLHPGNVFMDGLGNPCLANFGLTTVIEHPELDELSPDSRWRAPEVVGVEDDPERPTLKSDIYSFGGVMFFIVSGDIPWKEKKQHQICIELSRRLTPARPDNILDNHWDLITRCWSWNLEDRPSSAEVLKDVISKGTFARNGTRDTPQEYRGRAGNTDNTTANFTVPRNVVVCGEGGVGKSSLINLIAGRDVARISYDGLACTTVPVSYNVTIGGQCFRLWDTGWFDERTGGVSELTAFIRGLDQEDDIHLIIYCMRGTRRISAQHANYKRFLSIVGDNKAPTVIVVTGLENFRPVMAEWWNLNKDQLTAYGTQLSAHACITTLKYDPADSLDIRQRYAQSYEDVCKLILQNYVGSPYTRPGPADLLNATASFIVPRNVVVYGETGAGKSSLINLIAGRVVAETSPDAPPCTTIHPSYDVMIEGQSFRLWDTEGFDECSMGALPAAMAERHLTAFLHSLDQEGGVHLLVYCMRGRRAVRGLRTDYKIFSSVAREKQVPTMVVVTGLEDYPVMAEWWDRNKEPLMKHGMYSSAHACITTLKDDPGERMDTRQRRAQSYEVVCKLILDGCLGTSYKTRNTVIKDERRFLGAFARGLSRVVGTS